MRRCLHFWLLHCLDWDLNFFSCSSFCMTRASNWDEIIRAAHVMVRFLFSASLWVLLLVCDVLMGGKKTRLSTADSWQPVKNLNVAEAMQGC